jgi:hypothetical protein
LLSPDTVGFYKQWLFTMEIATARPLVLLDLRINT